MGASTSAQRKTARVKLEDIALDGGTQIRAAISEDVVQDYAEQMTGGAIFPDIVLFHDGTRYYVADGFHRVLASAKNQFRDINAQVHKGSKTEALWHALGANRKNGHRLTPGDKRKAIQLALKAWPDKSQRDIAEQIGCSKTWVQNIKKQVVSSDHVTVRVTGKDGKSYPPTRVNVTVEDTTTNTAVNGLSRSPRMEYMVAQVDALKPTDRMSKMRTLAAEGYLAGQIAQAVKLRDNKIDMPAERAGLNREPEVNSNRMIERIALDATSLANTYGLLVVGDLDGERLDGWIDDLKAGRKELNSLIRRLSNERDQRVVAAAAKKDHNAKKLGSAFPDFTTLVR